MGLSMNSFSDKLTNFKIKPRKDGLTPIQLSNKDLIFAVKNFFGGYNIHDFEEIEYDPQIDQVIIWLKEKCK